MRVLDPTVDVAAVRALLADEYAYAGDEFEFAPLGADSWCFRAGSLWVSVRRDRQGHVPAAYEAAAQLAEHGCRFALAPLRGADGAVVHNAGGRPVVVSPFVAGTWIHHTPQDQRGDIIEVVRQLHAAQVTAAVPSEDFALPFRGELLEALSIARGTDTDAGPYSRVVQQAVRARYQHLCALLDESDALAARCRGDRTPFVLTHSEPEGNMMRTADGRLFLFDWGSAMLGPPERDWWDFERVPSGVLVRPAFKRFYELRWVLGEVAEYVWRFVHPHADDEDDRWMWRELQQYVDPA